MKKQILFLILVVTSFNLALGQAVNNTDANPITCTTNGLNPIAGVPYTYSADLDPAGGTANWHVVFKPTALITAGAWAATDETTSGDFLSSFSPTTTATATSPTTTTIIWKTDGLASVNEDDRLILAIEYEAATANCANNLQVFEIIPKNAFTIDITTVKADGTDSNPYGTMESQCYPDIVSATYTAGASGAPGTVAMNYGISTMYFEIIAANFSEEFTPSFQLSGLQGGQTAELFWGYTPATATNSLGAATNGVTVTGATATTTETNTSLGVSIYVKVVINNNGYEGLSNDQITLAVDAVNSANQPDVLADCTVPTTGFEDKATQELRMRPTVDNPVPTPFLIKN